MLIRLLYFLFISLSAIAYRNFWSIMICIRCKPMHEWSYNHSNWFLHFLRHLILPYFFFFSAYVWWIQNYDSSIDVSCRPPKRFFGICNCVCVLSCNQWDTDARLLLWLKRKNDSYELFLLPKANKRLSILCFFCFLFLFLFIIFLLYLTKHTNYSLISVICVSLSLTTTST